MATKSERVIKADAKKKAQTQFAIVEEHRSEIEAMRRHGKKPSEIAEWLCRFGFEGSGGTLNGIMPWRPGDYAPKIERKKAGRPRIHKDSAARVKAFRASAGHRYDIHLGQEAAVIMRALQEQSGLSASGVVDAVLRGALKIMPLTKSVPVT
ncbi:MAG: hypothetical protein NT159_15770 [Proteobacteria bacterium]|nr:hypothetical protein [Pseudomonadota bacterium]